MNILITGSGGLIGSSLKEKLKENHKLFDLKRKSGLADDAGVTFIELDLSTDWDYSKLPEKADVIYHIAQSDHFREFPGMAMDVFKVNTYSTVKLLDYAVKAGVKKFIYASSGGIYGFGDTGFTEEAEITAHGDLGFYIGTKICSEILVENYSNIFDVSIIRFFFVYGASQKKSMLIPRLVENIRDGKPILLHGYEGIKINPVYVEDAAEALAKCMDLSKSHKINIGGAEVLSLKQICLIIGEALGKNPIFELKTEIEPKNIYGDIKKMCDLLVAPKTSFKEGIKKLL